MSEQMSHNFKRKIALVLLAFVSWGMNIKGQSYKALDTGTSVPDFTIRHFWNEPAKRTQFSDYKGKLVIVDFWSVWCSACIAGMPELDSLQEKFGDQVKILLVTKNDEEQVRKLFSRLRISLPHLEVVVRDTVFSELFPHLSEPHHAWIDADGTYRYSSFHFNTTATNIKEALSGRKLNISQKNEDSSFNDQRPLLAQAIQQPAEHIDAYSILVKGLYKVTPSNIIYFSPDSLLFRAINATPLTLLQCAFNREVYGFDVGIYNLKTNYRMLLEVKDPAALYLPIEQDLMDRWLDNNTLSYEKKVSKSGDLLCGIQNDLNNALPYFGKIELREMNCYVLKKRGKPDRLTPHGGKSSVRFAAGHLELNNAPLFHFVRQIIYSQDEDSLPFFDATGIVGNVDIKISLTALSNMEQLNRELKEYGLVVEREKASIPMLVIRDKN